jgi:uncharacterized RDD family membrane protein YckC
VFSVLEARGGQTPGKRLVGLEVRYLDGTPCDARSAIIRNIFRFLDWFPGVYVIGGFAIVSNRRRQRLGDQAAGTSVYRRAQLVKGGHFRMSAASRTLALKSALRTGVKSRVAFGGLLKPVLNATGEPGSAIVRC